LPKKHYEWKLGEPLPEIGPHSLAKHRILRRYIERYIEIVTATSFQEQLSITFVDGYCGGGRYQAGRRIVPRRQVRALCATILHCDSGQHACKAAHNEMTGYGMRISPGDRALILRYLATHLPAK